MDDRIQDMLNTRAITTTQAVHIRRIPTAEAQVATAAVVSAEKLTSEETRQLSNEIRTAVLREPETDKATAVVDAAVTRFKRAKQSGKSVTTSTTPVSIEDPKCDIDITSSAADIIPFVGGTGIVQDINLPAIDMPQCDIDITNATSNIEPVDDTTDDRLCGREIHGWRTRLIAAKAARELTPEIVNELRELSVHIMQILKAWRVSTDA
jgi:hypothetical protein